MQIQGIHYGDAHASLKQQPKPLLDSLAGNSFHTWNAAPVFLTREVCMAHIMALIDAREGEAQCSPWSYTDVYDFVSD